MLRMCQRRLVLAVSIIRMVIHILHYYVLSMYYSSRFIINIVEADLFISENDYIRSYLAMPNG